MSHSGDRTCLDTFEVSDKPVFITHAGARAVWPTPRMKPDDVLRACAAGGGVIGIEAAPHTTLSAAHPEHSIESVMDHFEYCAELLGIEHVAFGPDTFYGDHVGFTACSRSSSGWAPGPPRRIPKSATWREWRIPTENLPQHRRLAGGARLLGCRYNRAYRRDILRVLREVW